MTFLGSLVDTRFETFVATRLVRGMYVAALTLVSLQCFTWFLIGWSLAAGPFLPGIGWLMMLGTPAAWIGELAAIRVTLECVIVVFKLSEDVKAIRAGLQNII